MTDDMDESPIRSEELAYPETLRLTLGDAEAMFDDALATARAIDADDDVEPVATRAFQNVADLRSLLTDRRLEVLRSIHENPPESISSLAERLDRAYSVVHGDVQMLAGYHIVHLQDGPGQAKQPYVPYANIRLELPLVGSPVAAPVTRDEKGQDVDLS